MTKFIPVFLLVMAASAFAQHQTGNLPALERNETVVYKAFTIEQKASDAVATPAAMDTTKNLDSLVLSKDLVYRGMEFVAAFQFANTTDSIKFQQYDKNGDKWVTLPVKYKKRNATLASGQGLAVNADTIATTGVLTPVGTNLNATLTLDFAIPNWTNGDIRVLRGVQDTGAVKITYILPGTRSNTSGWKWR